jgi:hypothetical protein
MWTSDTCLIVANTPAAPNKSPTTFRGQLNTRRFRTRAGDARLGNRSGHLSVIAWTAHISRRMIRIMHLRTRIFLVAVCALCCLLSAEDSSPAKAIEFLGEVQSVDALHHTAKIKHVDIPGYAARGTSEYSVENEAVLRKLRPGDDIRATVYPNDSTLHSIRVVYRGRK